jgi:alcohol dehydrogenase class IV
MMMRARFSFPTTIEFGPGVRQLLPEALGGRGLRRPLLVTDGGVAELGWFAALQAALTAAGLGAACFAGVQGNPTRKQVLAGVDAYRAHGADAIVAVGGGAALDVAKVIALMVHHPGDPFDYIDGDPNARPVDRPLPWVVALPTTAGTGSEVGRSSVISDDVSHAKRMIFSPRLMPALVLADPEVTRSLPPRLTAATGFDALAHACEAFLATGYHPLCDGIALEAVRMVAGSLERCVLQGEDLEARGTMLLASLMGAVAFQKGLGVAHSLAHALSAVHDLHHGLATAVALPHALRFNAPVAEAALVRLAQAAGAGARAEDFLEWLSHLQRRLGLPSDLTAVLPGDPRLDELVEAAYADGCHRQNPRPVAREDLRGLFLGLWGRT